jgi:hypothetical protein
MQASALSPAVDNAHGVSHYWPSPPVRHTNFASEPVIVPFRSSDGSQVSFGEGLATCVIPHNGDLLHKTYLVLTLPRVTGRGVRWRKDVGMALLDDIALEIGGRVVDHQTADFMWIWNSLLLSADEAANLSIMINADGLVEQTLYVPLNFSFCENAEDALPLACLASQEVTVTVRTFALRDMLEGDVDEIHGAGLMQLCCDFVTVNDTLRQALVLNVDPGKYMIRQTQLEVFDVWQGEHELSLTGDCIELLIACSRDAADRFDFTDASGNNPVKRAVLCHDGHSTEMCGKYMNVVQPFQYHTGRAPAGVNVYSYALHPEQLQPSGSCDFSRVERVSLLLDLPPEDEWRVSVYAVTRRFTSDIVASSEHPPPTSVQGTAGAPPQPICRAA